MRWQWQGISDRTLQPNEYLTFDVRPLSLTRAGKFSAVIRIVYHNDFGQGGIIGQRSEFIDATIEIYEPEPVDVLTVTPNPIDFGSIRLGQSNPGAIPITITNNGDVDLTLRPLPNVRGVTFGNLGNTRLQANGGSRTVAMNVNRNLAVGFYSTTFTVRTVEGPYVEVEVKFTVTSPGTVWSSATPSGGGSGLVTVTQQPPQQEEVAETPQPTFTVSAIAEQFVDVNTDDWFYSAVDFAVSSGLFVGVSNDNFAPNATTTTAMFITVLARFAGVDTTDGDTWYSQANEWSVANGIFDGENVNDDITREQMAVILYRYQQFSGNIPPDIVMGRQFADWYEISEWARGAVNVLTIQDILRGREGGNFDPLGILTRAEVATILQRLSVR